MDTEAPSETSDRHDRRWRMVHFAKTTSFDNRSRRSELLELGSDRPVLEQNHAPAHVRGCVPYEVEQRPLGPPRVAPREASLLPISQRLL